MPILSVNLYLETASGVAWAPDGPGWYADVRIPNASGGIEIIPRVRLGPAEMIQLGQVLDNFVTGKELNWTEGLDRSPMTIKEAVERANATARGLIAAELAQAEAHVARLEALRKRSSEFGVDDPDAT